MEYRVNLTDQAIEQLQEIKRYISKVLQAPDVAAAWMLRMKKEIISLNFMPNRYPLTAEEPWHSQNIHKMLVENFFVYYWVNDETKIVWVTAIVYGKRNQILALRNMPLEKQLT